MAITETVGPAPEPTPYVASGWRPILTGEAAARAARTVGKIAKSLEPPGDGGFSLGRGSSGVALLRAYLARALNRAEHARAAVTLVDGALLSASRGEDPSLYTGLLGPAWVMNHLEGWILNHGGADPGAAVDTSLLRVLASSPWTYDLDLISGLVGMGIYALDRLPRPLAADCLEQVVERLTETAEQTPDGLTWRVQPHLLPDDLREQTPDGHFDLGLAHGVPGVILLLGRIAGAGLVAEKASRLAEGAVAWLLAQRYPRDGRPAFPTWIAAGIEPPLGAFHWCYGDAGLAAALFTAGQAMDRRDWQATAVVIALDAAGHSSTGSPIAEPGICHGSTGLAHIYNRFWQATGDDAFRAAACDWIERTPALLEGTEEAGFLEGRAGVGLVLLAALGVEPRWDVVLGLSHR